MFFLTSKQCDDLSLASVMHREETGTEQYSEFIDNKKDRKIK